MLALAAAAVPVGAHAEPPAPSYAEAVQRAYDLIQNASPRDTAAAAEATVELLTGTGNSQPEILADLRARPPQYDDARQRLAALLAALETPADTSDPALAAQRLHEVMAMSRYDPLHRPPSLLDRIQQWIQHRIDDLLRLLFGNSSGAQPPVWWFYVVGFAFLALIAFLVARAARGRFSEGIASLPAGPRPPADWFAEADRLAAGADRTGAIRALCAAVAATLAGEKSWEGSPLTVREIFQRAPDYKSLLPLLLPFEAAVYGRRDVDPETYDRAARVAAAYRTEVEAAA